MVCFFGGFFTVGFCCSFKVPCLSASFQARSRGTSVLSHLFICLFSASRLQLRDCKAGGCVYVFIYLCVLMMSLLMLMLMLMIKWDADDDAGRV